MREAQSQDSAMVVALGGALLSSAAGKLGDEGARPFRSCVLVAFNLALRVLLLTLGDQISAPWFTPACAVLCHVWFQRGPSMSKFASLLWTAT